MTEAALARTQPARGTLPLPFRLAQFVAERFPLQVHLPLMLAFALSGRAAAAAVVGRTLALDWGLAAVTLAVTAAFLQLRALDEIRDAAVDRAGRPHRPLPRGLVTARDLRLLAAGAGVAGTALALTAPPPAVVSYLLVTAVIWLAGHELLLRAWADRGIVSYALVHSMISPLLMAFAWWSADTDAGWSGFAGIVMVAWGGSLALEVARKTVAPADERPFVETYSGALGRERAVALAAGALAIAAGGASVVTLAADVAVPAVVVPLLVAGFAGILAPAARHGSTRAIQSSVGLATLALLVWPVLLSLPHGPLSW